MRRIYVLCKLVLVSAFVLLGLSAHAALDSFYDSGKKIEAVFRSEAVATALQGEAVARIAIARPASLEVRVWSRTKTIRVFLRPVLPKKGALGATSYEVLEVSEPQNRQDGPATLEAQPADGKPATLDLQPADGEPATLELQ